MSISLEEEFCMFPDWKISDYDNILLEKQTEFQISAQYLYFIYLFFFWVKCWIHACKVVGGQYSGKEKFQLN